MWFIAVVCQWFYCPQCCECQQHIVAHHFGILQADDRPRPLPLVPKNQLQPLKGEPQPGDVLSYRLLEIGEDFSPQVRPRLLHLRSVHSVQQYAISRSTVFMLHSA